VRLQQDQAAVLASYREQTARQQAVVALSSPPDTWAVTVYARVSAVVASDPIYGPHLVVVRQRWTGTPPVLTAAGAPEARCYPAPDHTVADYTAGEAVRLVVAHRAMIAERLA